MAKHPKKLDWKLSDACARPDTTMSERAGARGRNA